MTDIPLNDLRRDSDAIAPDLEVAMDRVLKSGWYVLGPENEQLEVELAEYLGVGHCITVANGTDALQLALTAVGVTTGDTVLTAANAGGYTSTAARAIGAVPVYADVDPSSMMLSVDTLEESLRALPEPPAAVVITHLFGRAADMTAIMTWADRHQLPIVEDCAQSLGAKHNDRQTGSFGKVAITSFYPTKNLGALGDGGAVFTEDPGLAAKIRSLRQYGWTSKYRADVRHGRNSRMDELQAAIVRVKLPMLDVWNERRRWIHEQYEKVVTGNARLVNRSGPDFVAHLAVLEVDDREAVAACLAAAGVRTDVHYPVPDHRQPIADVSHVALPETERVASRVLSVPIFPALTQEEVERVTSALSMLD